MSVLIINREKSFVGCLVPVECYVNKHIICTLRNGEKTSCNVESGIVEFKCNLDNNLQKLDPIFLDLRGSDSVQITIKVSQHGILFELSDRSKLSDFRAFLDSQGVELFTPTQTVGGYFGINEKCRKWAIGTGDAFSLENCIPYSYDDIFNFELLENGSSVTAGGMGSAIAGGLLFGGVGAIVGGIAGGKETHRVCSSLQVKITINNTSSPVKYINLISSPTNTNSPEYEKAFKDAQEILSLLQLISSPRKSENTTSSSVVPYKETSVADEIRKFKALLDDGIITEEEFNTKKKQLLGL